MLSGSRGRAGFTLVEIMVVIAVIGLLAMIAIPNFVRARIRAQETGCIINMRNIQTAAIDAMLDGHDLGLEKTYVLVPDYLRTDPECPVGFYEPSPGEAVPTRGYRYVFHVYHGIVIVDCPNDDPDEHNVNVHFQNP